MRTISWSSRLLRLAFITALGVWIPAYAQIETFNRNLEIVRNVLVGISVLIFTVLIMFAGIRMAAQHAKWSEISNIVFGGALVGSAALLAAALVG